MDVAAKDRSVANGLPARQAHGRTRRREGRLDHPIGREQVGEAVGIPAQDQAATQGQDIGGRDGWHAVFLRSGDFVQHAFIERS